jgi:probable H4MPT-linked C1 transfer pathway protein
MTGELADCFATKAEGVAAIIEAAEAAAGDRALKVYLTDGRLVGRELAMREPLRAAASNWHALARFAGRYVPHGTGLLLDIGTTTCDVVPLIDGRPAARGRTDPERLLAGELVYTGVERSPVCAVLDHVPWRGEPCPVAQELFATTWDVYLVLGTLPEEPNRTDTADGRPVTREAAWSRLARVICADRQMVDDTQVTEIARAVAAAQLAQIVSAAGKVTGRLPEPPRCVVISGLGEFVAGRVADHVARGADVISLREQLGAEVSRVATAHALAVVAQEMEP